MSQDQQTYTRATTASLIGLATQLLLFLLLLILGLYAQSKAVIAVTFYLIPGLWIWVLLWVLYQQHKLERAEAMEAARLADADARSAALFDEAGAQLAVARRRLENLYKWGMRVVSVLTGLYLLGVGVLLLYLNRDAYLSDALAAAPIRADVNASLLALLLAVGWMAGFLVARYVAGMTRVDAWQALRGGAGTLIGHVFLGILPLIAATVMLLFGNNSGFVYLALAIPIVMILLGLEVVLGIVFSFYRPRKAGEFVRPAFDSRVLGWLTRPESIGKIFSETLNYQFGFEISKSWFMRLLGKALAPLAGVCLAVILGMTCVVIVEPHQQAVVTRNGAFVRIADPGLSFKAPWPFGKAQKYDVNRVHSIRLGSRAHLDEQDTHGPILWTNQHVQEGQTEKLMVTAPPPGAGTTGGRDSVLGEMIGADIDVKYRIADLHKYAGIGRADAGVQSPDELLRVIATRAVTRYFATHDSDTLLSFGRAHSGEELQRAIQQAIDGYDIGLEVVFVSVSGVHPPQEVAADYHARINALQEAQTQQQQARQEANVMLATAAGDSERALQLSAMIGEYYRLDNELRELRSKAGEDDPGVADLQQRIAQQQAAIELMMLTGGGEASQRLTEARAERWTLSLDAEGRALRRETELDAFRSAPRYYAMSRYLDVLAQAMRERPKTILGPNPDAPRPNIVLDLPEGVLPGVDLSR